MGLFDKLFRKKINISEENPGPNNAPRSEKCREIYDLKDKLDDILGQDAFIAKSAYLSLIPSYGRTIDYFAVLTDSGSLENYCKDNGASVSDVEKVCQMYVDIEKIVDHHNEEYIKKVLKTEKEYLDNILKDVDSNILLDEEQRKVVLNDEDYCLVIAGAGAGKTTTVAAKVRYLDIGIMDRWNISSKANPKTITNHFTFTDFPP